MIDINVFGNIKCFCEKWEMQHIYIFKDFNPQNPLATDSHPKT